MYTATVVYHAPQTKNCRNIMAPRRVPMDRMWGGVGGSARDAPCGVPRARLTAGSRVGLDEVRLLALLLWVHAAHQVEDFDFAEVDLRRLGLQRDRARRDRLTGHEHAGLGVVRRPAAHLRLAVGEHRVAVGDVLDDGVAEHERLDAHPLIAVVR